ncbi:MAG: response regulator transcription factor [Flavobacteriales bacterium]|nr:response regulator transcription factor [Flavobacteriales bacterium]
MEKRDIRVSIIEDVVPIRENVCYYLELDPHIEMAGEFGSAESFFQHFENRSSQHPDILLLDIGLPGMSGLEALPRIREELPDVDVVMLTSYEDEQTILKALCSGAVGYISKKADQEEIVEALKIVQKGGSYMSPHIAREIVTHFARPKEEQKPQLLTERQLEIIQRLVDGLSYKEIADQLYVSVETVRSHIKKMYRALEVNNKAEAIALYLRGEID